MKIAVGFCYRTMSPSEFIVRMIQLWTESEEVRAGGLIYIPYRHWLYEARNQMVRDFLSTDADALMMVDTDMLFTTGDVLRLAALDAPVAAGVYMFDPTRLDAAVTTPDGIRTLASEPLPDVPGEVDYAGSGFMMVKREVFEKIDGNWFNHITLDDANKTWLWEDWSFCERVRDAGFSILLDPTIRPGHLKTMTITAGLSLATGGDVG